jgi:hypothetical protein
MSAAYVFGSGDIFLIPFGSAIGPNPTPMKVGTLQDVSIDISATNKELYGKNTFPVAVRRGKSKIECKAKFANITAKLLNDAMYGQAITLTQIVPVIDELDTPTTHVVTVAGSATFLTDLGVIDTVTGQSLILMPLIGSVALPTQYFQAAGVYTFNTGYTNPVKISYEKSSTAGQAFTVPNLPMGATPLFMAVFTETDAPTGNQVTITLNSCVASKFSLASKQEDFMIPEFDFSAFADSSGNVFTFESTN